MILRSLSTAVQPARLAVQARPAAEVFIQTQKHVDAPYGIILQPEHSALAGHLAEALSLDAFGKLPDDVILAASQHDFGWKTSDQAQIHLLGERQPRPFPALTVEETLRSWNDSISHARQLSPLTYVMVSRHFTLLGTGDAGRAEFVRAENARRAEIESSLPYSEADLERWAGAVGFCDLLSLYLCCGSRDAVGLPIAHPADPHTATAKRARLSWEKGSPVFSPSILRPQTRVSLEVRSYSGHGTDLELLALEWDFPTG